ncbi:MAG: TonB-dependent receptor [Rhodobacteraceae bacterium]|nr:TonB-dependent receptor [Paracoccaceae bacterium]
MNVSRNFLLVGSLFLILGILIGMYMGGSGEHTLAPAHAHINLLGFVLSVLFALVYRSYADMGASKLATYHFWLHVVGTAILIVMLLMLLTGKITEAGMAPMAPLAELAVLIGVILFLVNLWKNAK